MKVAKRVQAEVDFIPRSVSWRSDVLTAAETFVSETARKNGRRANLSEFVNEAVQEKIARQRSGGSSVIKDLVRKELACLLDL